MINGREPGAAASTTCDSRMMVTSSTTHSRVNLAFPRSWRSCRPSIRRRTTDPFRTCLRSSHPPVCMTPGYQIRDPTLGPMTISHARPSSVSEQITRPQPVDRDRISETATGIAKWSNVGRALLATHVAGLEGRCAGAHAAPCCPRCPYSLASLMPLLILPHRLSREGLPTTSAQTRQPKGSYVV